MDFHPAQLRQSTEHQPPRESATYDKRKCACGAVAHFLAGTQAFCLAHRAEAIAAQKAKAFAVYAHADRAPSPWLEAVALACDVGRVMGSHVVTVDGYE